MEENWLQEFRESESVRNGMLHDAYNEHTIPCKIPEEYSAPPEISLPRGKVVTPEQRSEYFDDLQTECLIIFIQDRCHIYPGTLEEVIAKIADEEKKIQGWISRSGKPIMARRFPN